MKRDAPEWIRRLGMRLGTELQPPSSGPVPKRITDQLQALEEPNAGALVRSSLLSGAVRAGRNLPNAKILPGATRSAAVLRASPRHLRPRVRSNACVHGSMQP